jgi:O-antigen ligase
MLTNSLSGAAGGALATGSDALVRGLRLLVIAGVLGATGAVTALHPLGGFAVMAAAYVMLRKEGIAQDAVALLIAGNAILTLGFANLGLHLGGMPIPLTELILLPLVALCLLQPRWLQGMGLPGVFLAGILTVAVLRLILDYPNHGTFALRDFTTPLEALAVVAGFWAYNRFGLKWADQVWRLSCLGVLVYGLLLFPLGERLAEMGPVVGLEQATPLLGQYAGTGPAVVAAFFFFLLRGKAPLSMLLGAGCLGVVAMLQLRGLYLALPLGAVVVMLAGSKLGTGLSRRIAGTIVVGVCLLAFVLPLGPEGRMGPVSASFATSQLGTLFGQEGPGEGSFQDRVEWLTSIWEQQAQSPANLIVGLGLGPDLADGAKAYGEQLIRKPHNDYLEILARFGLVGLVLWMGLFASLLRPIWRSAGSSTISANERSFQLWVLAAASAYMLIAATQPLLAFPYGTMPLFILLGMGLALARQAEARAQRATEAEAA